MLLSCTELLNATGAVGTITSHNNNTNNNNKITIINLIFKTSFTVLSSRQSCARVHQVHLLNIAQCQVAANPHTEPKDPS